MDPSPHRHPPGRRPHGHEGEVHDFARCRLGVPGLLPTAHAPVDPPLWEEQPRLHVQHAHILWRGGHRPPRPAHLDTLPKRVGGLDRRPQTDARREPRVPGRGPQPDGRPCLGGLHAHRRHSNVHPACVLAVSTLYPAQPPPPAPPPLSRQRFARQRPPPRRPSSSSSSSALLVLL